MNFSEYQKLTIKVMSDTGSKITDSVHMCLGMMTEVLGELPEALLNEDETNFKEELGDTFWYLANYATLWDLTLDINTGVNQHKNPKLEKSKLAAQDTSQHNAIYSIGRLIANLQDIDKKELAYGKKGDLEERQKLTNIILTCLNYVCWVYDFDMEAILQSNIDKLSARYPGFLFSDDKANNRDLKKEREILESNKK